MISPLRRATFRMNIRCFHKNYFASLSSFFAPVTPPLELPSRMDTHLWYVVPDEVKCPSLLNRYMELLSPSEKEYVLSMRGDQLQKGSLLARTLVRTTIARYQLNSHVDPRSLKFRKNIHGKPEMDWESEDGWCPPPLHFNVSHTSSLIACGVATSSPIGVDIEEKQRKLKHNILAFAKRYFSRCEVEHLSAILDSGVQQQEFIKLWTLKEAYVKALGRGFSAMPFNTFTIRLKTGEGGVNPSTGLDSQASDIVVESFDRSNNSGSESQFALLELASCHYAAICLEKGISSEIGEMRVPMRLTVRKTIPLVEDKCVSGADNVVPIGGLIKQF